jgi:hypothetical protein
MMNLKAIKENELGGFLLVLGSIVILASIFFEYKIGWIGTERAENLVPTFMLHNWTDLKNIWGCQMLGHFILLLAYFLLIKSASPIMRTFWSILIVCGIMTVIAFGLTLGSYYPSLLVKDSQPELFQTIRGGIGTLYKMGRSGILLFVFVFLIETFGKNGKIKKTSGTSILTIVLIALLSVPIFGLSMKLAGATWFIFPLTIGYYYILKSDGQKNTSARNV